MRTPQTSAPPGKLIMDAEHKEQSEKASSVHSDESLGKPKSWPQRQVARVTYFLTRWGVETNGYSSNFLSRPHFAARSRSPLGTQD